MAKIFGLFGSMQGKVADVVMAVRNGEQIVRKHQPIVYNPSTPSQVATRAKLKLMSQLSAVVAPVIAMPRKGSTSSRNLFVKKNYRLASFASDAANITLAGVQLTSSAVSLPSIEVQRDASGITAFLGRVDPDIDRMVYVLLVRDSNNKLRLLESKVVTDPGADDNYSANFRATTLSAVILAYGVRDNTKTARTVFGEMTTPTAETVAKLIVTRTLTEADVTLTETRGVEVPVQA